MKKILFLGGLRPGGAEHQMVILASLLKSDGYDVTYFSTDKSDFYVNKLHKAGISLIRIKENQVIAKLRLNFIRLFFKLYKVISHNKYDTVISFLGEWNFLNCILTRFRKTRHKAITGIRNNRDEVFLSSRERFYAKFEKYAFCKVSNSYSAKEKYSLYYPELMPKINVIYNIVDLKTVESIYECKKDNRIHIIVPASYNHVKNPMRLLEAVSLLSIKERECLKIDWYGNIKDGVGLYNRMSDFINDKQITNIVNLHDATPNILDYVNESDFVALFSTSEGLPNSICEGIMMGKPIIMSQVSDYNVLVDHNNGFLCNPYDVHSIRTVLSLVCSLSKEEILTLGFNSKLKAINLFSKEIILQQWKNII